MEVSVPPRLTVTVVGVEWDHRGATAGCDEPTRVVELAVLGQQLRKSGGPGQPLLDWLLDHMPPALPRPSPGTATDRPTAICRRRKNAHRPRPLTAGAIMPSVTIPPLPPETLMATRVCVRCGGDRLVKGICGSGKSIGYGFMPHGLTWWARNMSGPIVCQVEPDLTGCLVCGLVWFEVRPADLRDLIERSGGAGLKAALPGPPWPPHGTDPTTG